MGRACARAVIANDEDDFDLRHHRHLETSNHKNTHSSDDDNIINMGRLMFKRVGTTVLELELVQFNCARSTLHDITTPHQTSILFHIPPRPKPTRVGSHTRKERTPAVLHSFCIALGVTVPMFKHKFVCTST
jgi:hypothetical protein